MKNSNFSQGAQSKSNKIYDTITETMIELLESLKSNPESWEKPWILSENGLGAHNAVTKRPYSGTNQLFLSYLCTKYNYQFNRWLTFKQVQDLGGRVKKDQRSTMVVFMKRVNVKNANEGNEETTEDENEKAGKTRFYLTYYNVFNVDQCEGMGPAFYIPYPKEEKPEFTCIDIAEDILKNSGAHITYTDQDRAFYTLGFDLISLPTRKQFKSVAGFYGTAFHELGHWTGHSSRLARKLFNLFGDEDYAREELTAEMCSVFINSLCGIDIRIKQSAAYIESWLKALRKDKTAFIRATMQAQTAANYILKIAEMEHLKRVPEEKEKHEPMAA